MTKAVAPAGYSYICVETTFPSGKKEKIKNSYKEVNDWLKHQKDFNHNGYIPELNTENLEQFVYPIQDKQFRSSLAKYNSLISQFSNLSVIGTGGEFHYSDMQIIFRKSKTLVEGFLSKLNRNKNNTIPLIQNFINYEKDTKVKNKSISKLTYLHQLSNVNIPLIAEIGINHNGDISLAKNDAFCKEFRANFAKFQYYSKNSELKNNLTEFLHETADGTEISLNQILERSRLSNNDCLNLIEFGKEIELPVFFTVFDIESAIYMNSINRK